MYHLHSEDIGCQSMRLKAPVSKAAILPAFDFARAAKGPSIRNVCPPKLPRTTFHYHQAKIFEEFQRADSSITRKKGGTSVGLLTSI